MVPFFSPTIDGASALATERCLDLAALPGRWLNTDLDSPGIVETQIRIAHDCVALQILGAGEPTPVNWGMAAAHNLYGNGPQATHAMAFTATYDFGFLQCRLQGNVNLGLLVLASFNDFKDGSGRSSYFGREFFRAGDPSAHGGARPPVHFARLEETLGPAVSGSAALEKTGLLGTWHNTNAQSKGVLRLVVTPHADALRVHAVSAGESGPVDWGEAPASIYAKNAHSRDGMAFSASFDLDFAQIDVQANIKQGVLVVAYFTHFTDGSGRSSFFSREFYYRDNS